MFCCHKDRCAQPSDADPLFTTLAAAPQVYTSYDYSAPLRETREQGLKLLQIKLINLFASSSPELLTTFMLGNGTGFRVRFTHTRGLLTPQHSRLTLAILGFLEVRLLVGAQKP